LFVDLFFVVVNQKTFEGGFKPFNRIGMESNPSPFQKMSFETTIRFVTHASLYGDYETCQSPSSRLVIGRPIKEGTGIFEVFAPLKVEKKAK
jgi:DNA-directed RNA polymerase I subunit RPA1